MAADLTSHFRSFLGRKINICKQQRSPNILKKWIKVYTSSNMKENINFGTGSPLFFNEYLIKTDLFVPTKPYSPTNKNCGIGRRSLDSSITGEIEYDLNWVDVPATSKTICIIKKSIQIWLFNMVPTFHSDQCPERSCMDPALFGYIFWKILLC